MSPSPILKAVKAAPTPDEIVATIVKTKAHQDLERRLVELREKRQAADASLRERRAIAQMHKQAGIPSAVGVLKEIDAEESVMNRAVHACRAELQPLRMAHLERIEAALDGEKSAALARMADAISTIFEGIEIVNPAQVHIQRAGGEGETIAPPDLDELRATINRLQEDRNRGEGGSNV